MGRIVVKLTRADLEASRGGVLPDLIGPDVRLLFVGVNPGLRAVALQAAFAGNNRLYAALFGAGVVDRRIDVSSSYREVALAAGVELVGADTAILEGR
jgi:double-stranded uracil-DNA glycosylase